jgi:Domain of unknown function (DUF6473)
MADAFRGAGALDYFPCRYGASRLTFRGPRRETEGAHLCVLGGSETYGRFVPDPYPTLLEEWLGLPVVNLGCPNAGPDVFAEDPDLIAVANRASAVVVQVLSAQNLSNRYYSVHPRRNDRFLGATPALRALYREVDFTEFAFTRHLLTALQRIGPDRFAVIATELRQVWMRKMHGMLAEIRVPVVLLWVGDQAPPPVSRSGDLWRGPLLIDAEMMAVAAAQAAGRVDVVFSPAARAMGVSGMAFAPTDAPVAKGLPGPAAHREVAQALRPTLEQLLGATVN